MISEAQERGPTRVLSEYIAAARYEDIPGELLERVKILLLDSLGCSLGGALLRPGKMILRFFEEMGGRPDSTVHATGRRVPCMHAAYVNSALSNMLDMDDTLIDRGGGHPGATVIHPALAVAEKVGAGGKEILNAIFLGYEVSVRILNALAPTPERRLQVWGIGTFQILGAVTAAGKLLGLKADQLASAFGLAGFCAPVPFIRKMGTDLRPTSWLKNNFGWASMGGVLSALQAAEGFQGSTHLLDGERGFWIMAGSDRCDFEELTHGLGKEFHLEKIAFKPYASCRFTQTALDALKKIKAANVFNPSDIARIEVNTFYEAYKFKTYRGLNIIEAQFSLPYVIALELLGKSPSQGLSEEDLADETVLGLADLVHLECDSEADACYKKQHLMPSTITIVMKDGRRVSGKEDVPKGDLRKPLTKEEIVEKFTRLVTPITGQEKAETMVSDCMNIERSRGPLRISPP